MGLLSIFLIIGQIFGGSLAGGVFGTSISNPQAYRALYLIFAGIALLATCATSLLAPRARAFAHEHGLIRLRAGGAAH